MRQRGIVSVLSLFVLIRLIRAIRGAWPNEFLGTRTDNVTTARLPPSPPGLPLLGHLLPAARDPLGYLTRCAREYGDVVRLHAPGSTYYVLTHPEPIEHVLRSHHQDFIKWKPLRATARVFGNGL